MYEVGTLLVYGNTGVCRITGVTTLDRPGIDRNERYYVMEPLYQNSVIYTPVEGNKVFMRPVITREEADRLIDMIPEIRAEACSLHSPQQLSEHYQTVLQTHCCADLIELTMSIYQKRRSAEEQKSRFGYTDSKYMKRAEELLFGEFAVALGIPREEVPAYIAERIKGASVGEKKADKPSPMPRAMAGLAE